jgi:protease-4
LFITGLYGEQPHLRDLLDKIHVTPDFLTCGAYKSAGEMFMRSTPSPEAQQMYDWLFDSIFDTYVGLIADGRGQNSATVRQWIDQGIYSASKAAELGIIDAAEFRQEFVAHVKKQHGDDIKLEQRYGKAKKSSIDLSNPFAVFKIWGDILQGATKSDTGKKDAVAIVYVEGPIVGGAPQPSPFGSQGIAYSDPIRKALEQAAEDDTIKAVVLRVDSPGGSAVGSEIILQATRTVAAKKPFVVSMGSVAGSGGYYVACATETIFADASTITASIGVVTGKLATKQMWESVGINWHPIARGTNAGMLFSGETFTEQQRETMQAWMDEVYEGFKAHVMRIRGDRLTKPIDELAGGRVFTGRQALELGLIDRIGTLSDALRFAADKAGLKTYDIRVLPRPKNILELMISDLTGGEDNGRIAIRAGLTWKTDYVWQALAPVLDRLDPIRMSAMRRALVQLENLQREQVTLSMPEFIFRH